MNEYNIFHFLTSPLYVYSIYKLMRTFFGDLVTSNKKEIFSYFVFLIITILLVFVTRVPILIMMINLIAVFTISFNYDATNFRRIFLSLLIYIIVLIIEILVLVILGFRWFSIFEDSMYSSEIGVFLVKVTTAIVAFTISKFKINSKVDFPIPKIYYLGLLLIMFGTMFLFIISLNSNTLTISGFVIRSIVLIIVNMTLMLIDEKIYVALLIMSKQKTLTQQNEFYEYQLKTLKESNHLIKSIKHDMKDHLITIDGLYKKHNDKEFSNYIETIIGSLKSEVISKSNNFVVDSIVNFKLQKLADSNVDLKTTISIPAELSISSYDLTIILGNLLENAVAAVLKSKDKILRLNISYETGCLIIIIENSYSDLIYKNGGYITTKYDKDKHGYGLNNVRKVLEKYDSELNIEHNNKLFSVSTAIVLE